MNAPFQVPRGCPPGIHPREWRRAITRRLDELHTMMGVLIALLDVMDGDPDLEPWLAGFDTTAPSDEREADDSEAEFSLGWTSATRQDGRRWLGEAGDLEHEHDGGEPDEDLEAVNEDGGDVLDENHDAPAGAFYVPEGGDDYSTPTIPGGGSEADCDDWRDRA